jgi:hypothetical protein
MVDCDGGVSAYGSQHDTGNRGPSKDGKLRESKGVVLPAIPFQRYCRILHDMSALII